MGEQLPVSTKCGAFGILLSTGPKKSRRWRKHPLKQRDSKLAPEEGLEPSTTRLTVACSTIELLWNANGRVIYKPPPAASNRFIAKFGSAGRKTCSAPPARCVGSVPHSADRAFPLGRKPATVPHKSPACRGRGRNKKACSISRR